MAPIGGSIEQVSLGGRIYSVSNDADVPLKLGGYENETMANGDGTARLIKTRNPWSITDIAVVIDSAANDQEFLQELADKSEDFPVSIVLASGDTYQGSGQIQGPIEVSSQNATTPISLSGPGKLTKQ